MLNRTHLRRVAFIALIGVTSISACTSSSPTPGKPGSTGAAAASGAVGPAGGAVATGDGHVSLKIPAGALDQDVTITVRPIAAPVAGSVGQAYEIGPTGTQFKQPITIAFSYDGVDLGGKEPSAFGVSTVVDAKWKAISVSVVDPSAKTIAGLASHLSPYAIAPLAEPTTDGGTEASTERDADPGTDAGGVDACAATCGGGCVDLQTDIANCGACGVTCTTPTTPSTVACQAGQCVTTLANLTDGSNINDIVLTGSTVAWLDNFNSCSIVTMPMSGGTPSTVHQATSSGSCSCRSNVTSFLSTDGVSLRWGASGLCSLPLAGGSPTILVDPTPFGLGQGIAFVGTKPYWINAKGLETMSGTTPIDVSASGGNVLGDLVSDGATFYWLAGTSDPTHYAPSTFHSMPHAGGAVANLAGVVVPINTAAMGPDAIYVVGAGAGVGRVPTSTGAMQILYQATSGTKVGALAVDTSAVYWAEQNPASRVSIRSVPVGGGTVTTLWTEAVASASSAIEALASDGSALYWSTWETPSKSRVMKLTLH